MIIIHIETRRRLNATLSLRHFPFMSMGQNGQKGQNRTDPEQQNLFLPSRACFYYSHSLVVISFPWHIYSGGDSLFLLKNDRTVFTLISSRCDISFAEQPLADKVSI